MTYCQKYLRNFSLKDLIFITITQEIVKTITTQRTRRCSLIAQSEQLDQFYGTPLMTLPKIQIH